MLRYRGKYVKLGDPGKVGDLGQDMLCGILLTQL